MKLIDDAVLQWRHLLTRHIPDKIIMDDPGLVKRIIRQLHAPLALSGDCPGIRIEQIPAAVKQQAPMRIIGSLQRIGIFKLIRLQAEDEDRPYAACPIAFRDGDACIRFSPLTMKQQQLACRCRARDEREIHAVWHGCRPIQLIEAGTDLEPADHIQRLHVLSHFLQPVSSMKQRQLFALLHHERMILLFVHAAPPASIVPRHCRTMM